MQTFHSVVTGTCMDLPNRSMLRHIDERSYGEPHGSAQWRGGRSVATGGGG